MTTRAIVAGTLLIGGCSDPLPAAGVTSASEARAAPSDDFATAAPLWQAPVTAERFARRTFYTWTTTAQLDELRATRVLLSREESPERGASYFEQVVHALAERDPVARVLDTTAFARSRFAWPAPWVTRAGWNGEDYGDQLLAIELRPDAIVLALSTATGTFTAHDLADVPVALADVIARPERIGAVYFTADRDATLAAGVPAAPGTYREYVLCNEAMIASWSAGTAAIADRLAADATALEALARGLRDHPARPEVARAFAGAIAFANPNYVLASEPLADLARRLRATPKPTAIEGGGRTPFAGLGARRVPPRVVPARNRGTYGTYQDAGVRRIDKVTALAALARERSTGCRMCELVDELEPIARREHAVAILDRYASRPGHVLIVARRHEERIAGLAWDEYAALQRLAWDVCHALERTLAPRRIYVAALGSADPIDTSFPHFHLHVVPLADGGEADRPANVFTWQHGVDVFESEVEEAALRDRLRRALADGLT